MRNAPAAVEKVPDMHCQQLTWLEAPVINESSELKHLILEPTRNSSSSNYLTTERTQRRRL